MVLLLQLCCLQKEINLSLRLVLVPQSWSHWQTFLSSSVTNILSLKHNPASSPSVFLHCHLYLGLYVSVALRMDTLGALGFILSLSG